MILFELMNAENVGSVCAIIRGRANSTLVYRWNTDEMKWLDCFCICMLCFKKIAFIHRIIYDRGNNETMIWLLARNKEWKYGAHVNNITCHIAMKKWYYFFSMPYLQRCKEWERSLFHILSCNRCSKTIFSLKPFNEIKKKVKRKRKTKNSGSFSADYEYFFSIIPSITIYLVHLIRICTTIRRCEFLIHHIWRRQTTLLFEREFVCLWIIFCNDLIKRLQAFITGSYM